MIAKSAYFDIYNISYSNNDSYNDSIYNERNKTLPYENFIYSNFENDSIQKNSIISITQFKKVKGEKISENSYNSQIILIGLTLAFFIMATVIRQQKGSFSSSFSFRNARFAKKKVVTGNEITWNYALLIVSFFIFSLAIYQSFILLFGNNAVNNEWSIFTISIFWGIIIVFSFCKILIYKIYGFIFDLKREMGSWRKTAVSKINLLGVFCFIPILLILFTPINNIILIFIIGIFFVYSQIYLLGNLIFLFIEKKYDFLYLIMYLCTIEFIPYVFLIYWIIQIFKSQVLLH